MSDAPGEAAPSTYRDAWHGRRTRVAVEGKSVQVESLDLRGRPTWSMSARLSDLLPRCDRSWYRDDRSYKAALCVIGLAIPLAAIALWRYEYASEAMWYWYFGLAVLAVATTLVLYFFAPYRVQYAWFRYDSGLVAFTFSSVGPDAPRFEAFVADLVRRIEETRGASGSKAV